MAIPLDFRKQVEESIKNNTGAIFKKFFDEEDTPTWQDLLYCLHHEIKLENTKNFNKQETPYGNVLLSHDLYLVSHLERPAIEKYFPRIIGILQRIRESHYINMCAIGPKVCIGPHEISFHTDNWHAFALQCEGKAKWTLSDTKDGTGSYIEEFYPERGDMLFFPFGMYHKIETQDSPRGGIQFNAILE